MNMNIDEILSDRNKYHRMPKSWKKKHPGYHSCAVCKNRPIDFCNSNKRYNPYPLWEYKKGVTEEELYQATMLDGLLGTMEHTDQLKIFRKCKVFSWSVVAPFYPNIECTDYEPTESPA